MVVGRLTDKAVDHVFNALADGTRRDILLRSIRGELSVSRLAEASVRIFGSGTVRILGSDGEVLVARGRPLVFEIG